ncbi:MAG: hypothetical protein ISN64_04295 [Rickettsia sp.]|nr:hypothetical protein [Rickettsia sp.]
MSDVAVTLDNCIGLLDNEEKEIKNRAREIISFESSNFINKVRFYRSVYGIVSGEKEIEISYVCKIIGNYVAKKKISLEIDIRNGLSYLDGFLGRISIILFTIAIDAMSSVGKILFIVETVKKKDIIQIICNSNSDIKHSKFYRNFKFSSQEKITIYNCREIFIQEIIDNFLPDYNINVKLLNNQNIHYIIS